MKITKADDLLYKRYPNQNDPQNVYLGIDPKNETLSIGVNGEIGNMVPAAVWHNRIIRYTLPIVPSINAANGLLEQVEGLAERVIAGHSTIWDGSNYVGRMNADAQEASEQIEYIIEQLDAEDTQIVWDGDFLYTDIRTVGADTTDEKINALIAEIEAAAEAEGAVIDCDLREEMIVQREKKREEAA